MRATVMRIALALSLGLALLGLGLLSFALPVPSWRNGHVAFAALQPEATVVALPRRVWIDTDAACGEPGWHDPDDCLALLALLRRAEFEVVGVSAVFGNASLERTQRITRDLVAQVRGAVPVHAGCAVPFANCSANAASDALRAAIAQGSLTIVALGPLSTVARALAASPAQARAGVEIVAVMGRRPGHRFHPTENRSPGAWLFGHGPVFRDLNAVLDPDAVGALLALQPRLTLIPYEAARQVLLDAADLARIAGHDASGAWIAARSKDWLELWRGRIGLDGFYPFDLVAAMYVVAPHSLDCARVTAWLGRDPRLTVFDRAPALLVTQADPPEDRVVAAAARYCTAVHARVADVL